jgi:hypothetical protein
MKRAMLYALLLAIAATIGCGGAGNSGQNNQPPNTSAPVYLTGEDAPANSVVGFNVTIDKITLNNTASTVTALSTPEAVDFARLIGLRTLLGFNTIAQGTYTSVTFTFENTNPQPLISYVDLSTTPPSVETLNGSFSQTTVTVPFPTGAPLVVSSNGLAGLRIDFDIEDSLATTGGQINGTIHPIINVSAVSASQEVGEITEFTGNVTSVNAPSSFQMQGPYGMPRAIDVNSSTQYNGSNSINSLATNAIVSVIGDMQADGSISAKYVELITTDKAFIAGRVLAVNPTSGPVQNVTLWIGEELGTSAVLPVGTVQTIDLSGVSEYDVCFFDNFLSNQVFNNTALVVGQRILIGGSVSGAVFTPDMVSLRRQGVVGTLVANSVNITGGSGSNLGYFEEQNEALMSYSAGGPFTVYTGNATVFENIDGLSGLAAAGTPNLISRGLVFKDQSSGKPVVVAGRVRVLPAGQ